jgi:translocation and assembly module TamB
VRIGSWIVGAVGLVVIIIAITAVVLLHNPKFHEYLRHLAEEKASHALGTQVSIQNFQMHWSKLGADVYGVTIAGAPPYPTPPLLQVRHALVSVRVVSALYRKWYLDDVQIDDPVVHVFVDANGISNLPKSKNNGGTSHFNIFDFGIRHAVLRNGEVDYNDKKTPLAADLHDLNFRAVFDPLPQVYTGSLNYRDGSIQVGGFNPVRHDLEVQFTASRKQFTLTNAKLISGKSQFELTATLRNYTQSRIQGTYKAAMEGADLVRILKSAAIPSGLVQAKGSVEYVDHPGGKFLDGLTVDGELSAWQLIETLSGRRIPVKNVAGQYALANGNLSVRNFRANTLGGGVNAALDMRDLTGSTQSKLTATLRDISLAQLKQMVPTNTATRRIALGGVVNADANATWGKNFDDLIAKMDARIQGRMTNTGTSADVVPVEGSLQGTYFARAQQLTLAHSYLRTPETSLTMNGTIGNGAGGGNRAGGERSGLAVQIHSQNLAELETIADLVRTSNSGNPSNPLGLGGTASFNGMVRGTTNAPEITGTLIANNFAVKGTNWRHLQAELDLGPSLIHLQNGDLEDASKGKIQFNISAHLKRWSFTQESPVQVDLQASQMQLAELEKLAGRALPVTGTLAANLHVRGSMLDPQGQGTLTVTHVVAYEQRIPSVHFTFAGSEGQVHGQMIARVAEGSIHGTITAEPRSRTYSTQFTANGIQLDQLAAIQAHGVDVQGQINLHASGQGTFENPQLAATLQIPHLAVQQQKIEAATLHMQLANHVATADLTAQALNTAVEANARVNLTGDYLADAALNTKPIQLQPVFAVYVPTEADNITGQTEIHATLHGPLKDKKLLQAQAVLPMLQLNYGNAIYLAAAEPIHITLKNGVVEIARTAIRGTETDLQVQGSIPLARNAPASVLLLGTVNLKLAQLMGPDIRSSGQLQFNINSYGARSDPNVEGQVQIVNASFTNGNLPVGMQRANGVLTLTRDRLNIQSFKAQVGGGTVTAQGGVAYRPSIQFDLGASAQGVRMLYPQGMREQMDADIRMTGTSENALLGGRVNIQSMSFTPSFDLMNFVSQLSSGVAPPPSQGFAQNLQLNLAVTSNNNLNLVSRALSIDGTANLQVRGTAAQPVILGRINLNDGDVIFNGNRFTLAGGTVEFVNPAETQPVVNLALNTTIQQYNISLRFNGPVDQLRTNYSSDPSLPAADIINLLAFGQTTEATAANPTPGDQAAMSAVASQVSSQITSRIAKVAGISQLSINPVLAGGSTAGPAGAVVTVQQRVTGNLFVTFSSNVTSTQSQVIMGQYQVSRRFAISATRDQNGGFAFDTIFKKTW